MSWAEIILLVLFVLAVVFLIIAIIIGRTLKNKKRNHSCGSDCLSCPLSKNCQIPRKTFEVRRKSFEGESTEIE